MPAAGSGVSDLASRFVPLAGPAKNPKKMRKNPHWRLTSNRCTVNLFASGLVPTSGFGCPLQRWLPLGRTAKLDADASEDCRVPDLLLAAAENRRQSGLFLSLLGADPKFFPGLSVPSPILPIKHQEWFDSAPGRGLDPAFRLRRRFQQASDLTFEIVEAVGDVRRLAVVLVADERFAKHLALPVEHPDRGRAVLACIQVPLELALP